MARTTKYVRKSTASPTELVAPSKLVIINVQVMLINIFSHHRTSANEYFKKEYSIKTTTILHPRFLPLEE